MLFLLVTLLANYGDASCHSHAYRLQSAIRQELDSQAFLAITRYGHPGRMYTSVCWARVVLMPTRVPLDPALGPAEPGHWEGSCHILVIRTGMGAAGNG